MPKILKQNAVKSSLPATGVLSRIEPIDDGNVGIKLLIYGRSGTGKTTFWASFPGKILVLLCSGAIKSGELRSINTPENRKRVSRVNIESSRDIFEVAEGVSALGVDTVVLDHATGMQDLVLKEILGLDEMPTQKSWGLASQQQYGQCALQCKELFRALLNLPCNVVIVAQEREFNNEAGSELLMPYVGAALTPSLVGWLNPACDFICQTFVRPRKVTTNIKVGKELVPTEQRAEGVDYCLRVGPHDVYTTKFRIPKGCKLPEVVVDPTYQKLIGLFGGGD